MNKINYKKSFLLGFGFFAVSITWSIYNSFVPYILKRFVDSAAIIGFIMTIDNYLALFIQPAVGALSDRIDTGFGKRMPFIIIGMPIASIFMLLIPNYKNLATFLMFIILMNLAMSIFRSPVISLMPDITAKENRSKVNSIINFMGGIGAIIAYFVGSKLWDKNESYPFYMAGGLMLLSLVILILFINEKRDVLEYEVSDNKTEKKGILDAIKISDNPSNVVFLLLAICCWFIAYQGIEAHFTNYGVYYIGVEASKATISFTFISVSFLIFSIPAGIIGTKLGKKKTIIIGITGLIVSFFLTAFMMDINKIRILFIFSGFFWAMININSYPFVTDMAPKGNTGAYTGLYYMASSIAAIISPPILGLIIDIFGYEYSFIYGAFFFIMALFFISKVKINNNIEKKIYNEI